MNENPTQYFTLRPRFTEDEYRAVVALENDRNFKALVQFMGNRAVTLALMSTDQVGEQCYRLQGRSKELGELVACITNARKDYEAIRKVEEKK